MYYKTRFSNKKRRYTNHLNKRDHYYPKKDGERKNYILDVIVKAVATGVFLFSIVLNIILILIVILMGVNQKNIMSFRGKEASYTKEYIRGDASYSNSFVVIDINGIISEVQSDGLYDIGSKESMVEAVKNRLKIIEKAPGVKGIILLISSPGGSVTASDMIYHEIEKFKKDHSIPVISYIKDIGASGAYYIASATDYIISYPTAITGSIGVIMYNFNFKNLMEKYGVRYVVIKSGKHKDLMSPFKKIDPEEIKWMQGIVNELLNRFIGVVKRNRKSLTLQQIKKLADGRIYTAAMAKKVGLIDEVGYFDDALKYLEELTKVSSYSVYRYVKQRQLGGLLNLITKMKVMDGYGRYLTPKIDRIESNHGIKLYYLMDSWAGNGLNTVIY